MSKGSHEVDHGRELWCWLESEASAAAVVVSTSEM